jgi:sulfur carrier protein
LSAGGDPAPAIRITVNGRVQACPPHATLGSVVAAVAQGRTGIAAAVGDAVVPRAEWDRWSLRDGDEIEILTAVQGG